MKITQEEVLDVFGPSLPQDDTSRRRPVLRRDHFHISTHALKHAATTMPMGCPDPEWFNQDHHDSIGNLTEAYEILCEDAEYWNERQRALAAVATKKANLTEALKNDLTNLAGKSSWMQNLTEGMAMRLKAFQDPFASDDYVQVLKEKFVTQLEADVPPPLEEIHGKDECIRRRRLGWALMKAAGSSSSVKSAVKRGLLPPCMLNGVDLQKAYDREEITPPADLSDYENQVAQGGLWAEIPDAIIMMAPPLDWNEESIDLVNWGYGQLDDQKVVPAGLIRLQVFPKTEQNRRHQMYAVFTPTQSYPAPPSPEFYPPPPQSYPPPPEFYPPPPPSTSATANAADTTGSQQISSKLNENGTAYSRLKKLHKRHTPLEATQVTSTQLTQRKRSKSNPPGSTAIGSTPSSSLSSPEDRNTNNHHHFNTGGRASFPPLLQRQLRLKNFVNNGRDSLMSRTPTRPSR